MPPGGVHSPSGWRAIVAKLDASGEAEWERHYNSPTWRDTTDVNAGEIANFIQQTSDGGYIVAGQSGLSFDDGAITGGNAWIFKLNASGGIEWQKTLGGSEADGAYSIQQTSDGGYIFAGFTNSNDGDVSGNRGGLSAWIVKLNASGEIKWQKCFGGSGTDGASSIQQTSDGGYIFAGFTNSNDGDVSGNRGGRSAWIVKLNASGEIEWQKCFGGSGTDVANSIQQTSDGGYIFAGITDSNDGDVSGNRGGQDAWIVKLAPGSGGGVKWWQRLLFWK